MQKEMTDTIEKYGEPTFKSNLNCYYGTEKVLEKMHYFEAMKIGPKIFVTDNVIQYSEKVQQMIGYVSYEIKSRASKGKVVTTLLPSIGICTKKIGRRQAVSIQSYPPSSVRIPEVAIKASDEFTDECKAAIRTYFTGLKEAEAQAAVRQEVPPGPSVRKESENGKIKTSAKARKEKSVRVSSSWQLFSKSFFLIIDVPGSNSKEDFTEKQRRAAVGWKQFPYDNWKKINPDASIDDYALFVANKMTPEAGHDSDSNSNDTVTDSDSDSEREEGSDEERKRDSGKKDTKKEKEKKKQEVARTDKKLEVTNSRDRERERDSQDAPVGLAVANTQTAALVPVLMNYLLTNMSAGSSNSSSSSSTSSSSSSDDTDSTSSDDSDSEAEQKQRNKKNKQENEKDKRKDKKRKKKNNKDKKKKDIKQKEKKKKKQKKEKKKKEKKRKERKRKSLEQLTLLVTSLAPGAGSAESGNNSHNPKKFKST